MSLAIVRCYGGDARCVGIVNDLCALGEQTTDNNTLGTHDSYIKPSKGSAERPPPRRRVIFLAADRGLVICYIADGERG